MSNQIPPVVVCKKIIEHNKTVRLIRNLQITILVFNDDENPVSKLNLQNIEIKAPFYILNLMKRPENNKLVKPAEQQKLRIN